jgi:hypothetical protein
MEGTFTLIKRTVQLFRVLHVWKPSWQSYLRAFAVIRLQRIALPIPIRSSLRCEEGFCKSCYRITEKCISLSHLGKNNRNADKEYIGNTWFPSYKLSEDSQPAFLQFSIHSDTIGQISLAEFFEKITLAWL